MGHLVQRTNTDIRATLASFLPGENISMPYKDVKDENGNIVSVGSYTQTAVWSNRYRTLRKDGILDGKFIFRSYPGGTIICRTE